MEQQDQQELPPELLDNGHEEGHADCNHEEGPSPVDFTILEAMLKLYPANAADINELLDKMSHEDLKTFVLETMSKPAPPIQLPPLTDDLRTIMGMPNFQCSPIAHVYQKTTNPEIPKKAEHEQAFAIHKMVNLALANPEGWRADLGNEIEERTGILKKAKEAAEREEAEKAAPAVVAQAFVEHPAIPPAKDASDEPAQ